MRSFQMTWLTSICFLMAACSQSPPQHLAPPRAERGTLDLHNWNFEQEGPIGLTGEWGFTWQRLLSPSQAGNTSDFTYVPVPDTWTDYQVNGETLPVQGFATYRLRSQLPESSRGYALFVEGQGSAYTLWIDGQLIAQNGQVGESPNSMTPRSVPTVVFFQPRNASTEFVLQISNFNHRKAGFRNALLLGLPEQIHTFQRNAMAREAAVMGIYLVMVLYHLSIYFFRPADKSPLYFALWGFLFFIRVGLLNQKILLLLLPALSWQTALRLEYLTFYLIAPPYALFMQSLYPVDVHPRVIKTIVAVGLGFSLFLLFADTLTISYTATLYQFILLAEIMYFAFFILRIWLLKREGAGYIALASLVGFSGVILETLYLQNVIPFSIDGTLTFLAFILIQAIMLSSRLSSSFRRVEILSSELKTANTSLQRSERKYRSIFEEAKDLLFIADLSERILETSPSSQDSLGYTPAEMKGMRMSDLVVHEDDRAKVEAMLRDQSLVRDYELELSRKDGSRIQALITMTLRRDEQDQVSEIQGRVHNISARKQAEAERLRAMEFERLAITDPLTNVYNRRIFDEIAHKEWERAKRSHSPLSVAMIDIDHFKQLNDTYGHLVGDQALIGLARLCMLNLRNMDIFARYGGEEFIVLMPDADEAAATQSLERLRRIVQSTAVVTVDERPISITISAGLATRIEAESIDFRQLLRYADQALYASKQGGRNRVTAWEDLPQPGPATDL